MIGLLKGLTDWISAGSLSIVEVGCKEVPTDMARSARDSAVRPADSGPKRKRRPDRAALPKEFSLAS
jgi:hypothetical protein